MAIGSYILPKDFSGSPINARPFSDTVLQLAVSAAGAAESITAPTGADVVVLSANGPLYVLGLTAVSAADVVVNGAFANDTDWTKGTGWTIGAGVATATGAISTALSQTALTTNPIVAGRPYFLTYTVTRSAGTVTPNIGGTAGTARSTSSTFTETVVAGATQAISFTTAGFTGTVDDFSAIPIASVPTDNTLGGGTELLISPTAYLLKSGDNTPVTKLSVISPTSGATIVTAAFYKLAR